MTLQDVDQLAALILRERGALLATWRDEVRQLPCARNLDTPTLNDHIPSLLVDLAVALRSHSEVTIPEALHEGSPPAHGVQRLRDGFDIEEVVAEYNILRGCIHDLADRNGLSLQGQPFHIYNRVLDGAIGSAVQAYATHQALEVQRRREEHLAFVAHDLRTPLNAIAMSARVLEQALPREGVGVEAPQMLRALHRNVKHLDGLVRKILDENLSSETEMGVKLQRRSFDLWPLVESLIHDLRPVASTASTRLINEVPEDLVAYADASLLTRVLQNLMANAIRYTPHGEVRIGARARAPEGAVDCWVADNGAGIPKAFLEKIFDKGEADPKDDEGRGLGLAIVKTFVEAHGGTVRVESQEGVGSSFSFALPGRA